MGWWNQRSDARHDAGQRCVGLRLVSAQPVGQPPCHPGAGATAPCDPPRGWSARVRHHARARAPVVAAAQEPAEYAGAGFVGTPHASPPRLHVASMSSRRGSLSFTRKAPRPTHEPREPRLRPTLPIHRALLDVTEGRTGTPARRPSQSVPRGAHWRQHGVLQARSRILITLVCAAGVQTVWERFRKEGQLNTDVVSRVEAEELQQRLDALQREVHAWPGLRPLLRPSMLAALTGANRDFPSVCVPPPVCTRVCMQRARASSRRSAGARLLT